jgi:hypothetical protein
MRRRLIRRLFTLAAAASAVLCIGVCGLWVRSYWRIDAIDYGWAIDPTGLNAGINAWTNRGIIVVYAEHGDGDPSLVEPVFKPGWARRTSMPQNDFTRDGNTLARRIGFGYEEGITHPPKRFGILRSRIGEEPRIPEPGMPRAWYSVYAVPFWFLVILTAIAPAARLRPWKRRRVRTAGHCPTCGYDLRATPGRCPECGTVPAAAGMGAA